MDYIIIVAGGKGLRMGGDIPKQFLPIKGKPVLMRTIERFHECSPQLRVILVLPREQQDYWHTLCRDHSFGIDHTVVDGGDTRFGSCRNGLAAIPDDEEGVVGIHDGVRPFVSADTVERCFARARQCGAAIPVLPVTDSLRRVSGDGKSSHGVNRSEYRAVQTPQAFSIQVLKKAYRQPYQDSFTDDASVVEAMGVKVDMVEGNRENIKLTTPFDLKIAETLC
ncbi:MAG: 2-C-methyl-D-erythritol 4-phosphate cytidylyltransferase [Bacteroidales bacterium]|nr:2-C-methyl-D-erythritol 4-phosphate cytidylyltransferase [Bacteroidales bacterium]MDD6744528.1 2-C-methyl-D-erythritol 4-phosphate cytidylyltransferase [Bacteroidales bacterium]